MVGIVRSVDLREQVYDSIKESILCGKYTEDAVLLESVLAIELDVSRTPVREALFTLASDGLLMQGRRGYSLPKFTEDQIKNIIEIRLLIEPFAIRKVTENLTTSEAIEMGDQLTVLIKEAMDSESYVSAHREARRRIFSAVGNLELQKLLSRYEDSIHFIRIKTLRNSSYRSISALGMLNIIEAIREKDAEKAYAFMICQLRNAEKSFVNSLKLAMVGIDDGE